MSITTIAQFQSATYMRTQNSTPTRRVGGGSDQEPRDLKPVDVRPKGAKGSGGGMVSFFSMDIAMIQEQVDISPLSTIEQANELLMQRVRDTLNKMVEMVPELEGVAHLDPAQHTPEKTAEFIVKSATSFYPMYAENHADEDGVETLEGFMSLIRGAIDEGFAEAREILNALNVLNGDIAAGVDKTYDLVQEGLDQFYQARFEALMSLVDSLDEDETEVEASDDEDDVAVDLGAVENARGGTETVSVVQVDMASVEVTDDQM